MRLVVGLALLAAAAGAGEGPYRHPDALYPHLSLAWQAASAAGERDRIWPHPLLPGLVVVTGERGLAVSADGGTTWAVPAGLPAGAVSGVAFHPTHPAEMLVATPAGLWRSADGSAWARLPAADLPRPVGVWYHPRDPGGRIILVAHGEHAPGLSLSRDGGATWRRAVTDYHIHRVFPGASGEQGLTILASPLGDDAVRSLLCLATVDEKPVEAVRDGTIADGAVPIHLGKPHYASLADGLLRLEVPWDHGIGEAVRVPCKAVGDNGLTGLAFAWGAHVDRQLMLAFDPYGQGVVCNEGGEDWFPIGAGLPVGAMVKEGAQFRANANGSRFYAILNDRVYVGRPGDLRLDGMLAQADPPVALVWPARYGRAVGDFAAGLSEFNKSADPLAAARGLRPALDALDATVQPTEVVLRARIAPGAAPRRVTVDLTRFGQAAEAPLYDDGRHDDGAVGDGLWATRVRIRPGRLSPVNNEWRRTPGILGLSVTAHWSDEARSGAVIPLMAWRVAERFSLADRDGKPEERLSVEGAALAVQGGGKHDADPEMRLVASGGPWSLTVRFVYHLGRTVDLSPYATIGFDWRGSPAKLHLRDHPLFDEPSDSATAGFTAAAGADGWAKVRVPIASLVPADAAFSRNHLVALVFSGEAKAGEEIVLRSPCLLPEGEP